MKLILIFFLLLITGSLCAQTNPKYTSDSYREYRLKQDKAAAEKRATQAAQNQRLKDQINSRTKTTTKIDDASEKPKPIIKSSTTPFTSLELYNLMVKYYDLGDYETALHDFFKIKQEELPAELMNKMSDWKTKIINASQLQNYNISKAAQTAELNKTPAEKNYDLGLVSQKNKDYPAALKYYTLAGFPTKPVKNELNLNAAICLFETNKLNEGFEALTRYQSLGGSDSRRYYFLGVYFHHTYLSNKQSSDLDSAITNFKLYEKKKPFSFELYEKNKPYSRNYEYPFNYKLALCYNEKPFYYNKTIEHLKSEIYSSRSWESLKMLIDLYNSNGQPFNAIEYLTFYFKDYPTYRAEMYSLLAWSHGMQNNFYEGLLYSDSALAINTNIARTYAIRGYMLFKKQKYEEALVCCNKSIELDNSNGLYYFFRSRVLYMSGKSEMACADLQQSKKYTVVESIFVTPEEVDRLLSKCK